MTDVRREPPAKRRRRRKRRKQDNKDEDVESSDPSNTVVKPNSSSGPLTLDEPLTIPSALLGRYDHDRQQTVQISPYSAWYLFLITCTSLFLIDIAHLLNFDCWGHYKALWNVSQDWL